MVDDIGFDLFNDAFDQCVFIETADSFDGEINLLATDAQLMANPAQFIARCAGKAVGAG